MKTLKRYSLGKDGLPTAAAINAYERDGVVCIQNAFDPQWVGSWPSRRGCSHQYRG